MQMRNSEVVVHGQKQSWSTLPSLLGDEENDFGYKLDTLALKKTANKTVFDNVSLPFLRSFYIGKLKTLLQLFSYEKTILQIPTRPPSWILPPKNSSTHPFLFDRAQCLALFVSRCSSCCSSRLYTRRISWETRYPTGRGTRPLV